MTGPSALTIRVLRPALVGVDTGDSLGVDRDIEFDDTGLPIVRRHRISARLRDAALVASASDASVAELMLGLIGTPRSTAARRKLVVGHARPDQQTRSAAWHGVTRDVHANPGRAQHLINAIKDACTVTITSARLDTYGAPVPGSLREERALRPDLVLHAPFTWQDSPSAAEVTALAKCVVGLQQFGAKESRGLGQIECSLDGDLMSTRDMAWMTGAV